MPFGGTFITGENVEFRRKFRAEVGPNGRIEIGEGSYLTYDVIISCDTTIEIGERCGLGAVHLRRRRQPPLPRPRQAVPRAGLRLPRRSGSRTTRRSIRSARSCNSIGTRSVIGANAVVSREIPPYCLAAGVPARVIDYFGPPGQEPPGWEPRQPEPVVESVD